MKKMFASFLISLACTASAQAAIFQDNFNSAASAGNYNVVASADTAVQFGFDYSTLGIAAAPNTTDGSTMGLRMAANLTSGSAQAVTLHSMQTFSGDYRITFDAWINANGPFPGGGTGSTEFLTLGVGGDGTTNNLGSTGVGGWFAGTGEGGSARDYRAYKGAAEQFAESGQFAAGTASTPSGGSHNSSDVYYGQFGNVDVGSLPQASATQTGTTSVGALGFQWHQMELLVEGGNVTWSIDGLRIATLDPTVGGAAFASTGSATIGYMDIFTSVSDAPQFSFGLVDNLSVSAVPEPSSLGVAAIGGVFAFIRRRRR